MTMNFERARQNMVEQQVRTWEVLDSEVLYSEAPMCHIVVPMLLLPLVTTGEIIFPVQLAGASFMLLLILIPGRRVLEPIATRLTTPLAPIQKRDAGVTPSGQSRPRRTTWMDLPGASTASSSDEAKKVRSKRFRPSSDTSSQSVIVNPAPASITP